MNTFFWNFSAKGNFYADIEGLHCVVGNSDYGWFVLVNKQFLKQKFSSENSAKKAAVKAARIIRDSIDALGRIEDDSSL